MNYFKLFANCINVRGATDSLIMDLQRESYLKIPSILSDVLEHTKKNISINDIKEIFNHEYDKGIDEFFNYFVDNNYGFFTTTPELFPELNKNYITPFECLTSVICFEKESDYNLNDTLSQLIDLGTQSVQIRVSYSLTKKEIIKINNIFKKTRVKIVDLIIPYDSSYDLLLDNFNANNDRLHIYVLSSPINRHYSNKYRLNIVYLKQAFEKYPSEIIKPYNFFVNYSFYNESLAYNGGLNRKVSIDYDGGIKNYVDHEKVYGNVKFSKICDIIVASDFMRKWHIHNDLIEKCKDCEFRYMCLNNSDIIANNGKFFKLITCEYDPYNAKNNDE